MSLDHHLKVEIHLKRVYVEFFFFFFSSRRRHTRFDCDWSSDVCSSDLNRRPGDAGREHNHPDMRTDTSQQFRGVRHAREICRDVDGVRDQQSGNGDSHERSEEHTSELQSQSNLVCRLLLEKKTLSIMPRRSACSSFSVVLSQATPIHTCLLSGFTGNCDIIFAAEASSSVMATAPACTRSTY